MTRHQLEVADVFRTYGRQFLNRYGSSLSVDQKRAFRAISACRTSALGGHLERCDDCAHERNAYNSCANRHCPKCQGAAQAKWADARTSELLPIPYLHATFTLPNDIGPVALQNKRVVYDALFLAAAATLKEVAANPKHLGAEIGILAVLHTWGQKIDHHVHVHCIVSGGGISPDGCRWVHCRRTRRKGTEFFAPRPVLSLVFRGKFIALLKRAYRRGELQFHGKFASLAQPKEFEQFLNRSVRHRWIVDVQPPYSSPEIVLKYFARYTHRVAISNRRLLAMENGKVRFRYKDYADGNREKTLELEATEFIRRFLLHILPSGFMKIRHYGFLANRFRREKLALCHQLLSVSSDAHVEGEPDQKRLTPYDSDLVTRCPFCGRGKMIVVRKILPEPEWELQRIPTHSRSPPRRPIA